MKLPTSKKTWIAAVAVLLLLFLLRPGASRLKSRIIVSMSSAIGRSVDLGAVHIRLLPRPGFDLDNLVVFDDPAFGAEPILRSSEVSAAVRLIALLQGRLEIARLDLTEPSLNLVRDPNGHWNVEGLLERTAHAPTAPTAKSKRERRPGFPYIDASSARINFKNGPEKTPYALTNADFSLWQDSENSWGVRLKAQPVRTDLNLNDTGLLRLSGTWQRADSLRDTPLEFTLEWDRAQLGQLTKFLTSNDMGWRGAVRLESSLSGTPAKLKVAADVSLDDFRRYDITSGEPLLLTAHCDARYSSTDLAFHSMDCRAPLGSGLFRLKGEAGLFRRPYTLAVVADDVPAAAILSIIERAKKNLAADLVAGGTLRGSISLARNASGSHVNGRGEIVDFRLTSAETKAEVGSVTVPLVWSDSGGKRNSARYLHAGTAVAPEGMHMEAGPFVAIDHARARAWIDRSGYSASFIGDADIAKTLRLARMLGIPATQAAVEGSAQMDLQIAGLWAGPAARVDASFSGPQVTGIAKLRDTRVTARGISEPVDVSSAEVQLRPDGVSAHHLVARAADTTWTGSLDMPRGCGVPAACEIHFALSANRLSIASLTNWVHPQTKRRPWYRVLDFNADAGPIFWQHVRASGRIRTERLELRGLEATRVSADVKLDAGKLELTGVDAEVLGGQHHGELSADFLAKPPTFTARGSVGGFSLGRLGAAGNDSWVTGTADGKYEIAALGSTEEFWTSTFWTGAEGTLQFDVRDGGLPHVSLSDDEEGLKVSRFAGIARLHSGKIELKDAKLDSGSGKFLVSGVATLQRDVSFKLSRTGAEGAGGFAIAGTLPEPRVTVLPGTEQARLKP